ncbi:hypothetical protein CDAR_15821 [Caerostris darwini]|uniref:Uncharacterized protein n=1 Tax=Caerostris darwini TaxID=1538125 RepID=A0AAV4N7B7_9ARAC|nr:hypothetical protein CDAR_15821 [Caerostris darwini]
MTRGYSTIFTSFRGLRKSPARMITQAHPESPTSTEQHPRNRNIIDVLPAVPQPNMGLRKSPARMITQTSRISHKHQSSTRATVTLLMFFQQFHSQTWVHYLCPSATMPTRDIVKSPGGRYLLAS